MVKIASYNVENLFARPAAFNQETWAEGAPYLAAYARVNELFEETTYTAAIKRQIRDELVTLGIYVNNGGVVRKREPRVKAKWAFLRANRGKFDKQPEKPTKDVEIVANGRDDWIGWVELVTETTDETSVRLTAQVILDVDADIIGIVEAEDRPSLVRFNKDLLGTRYEHVMLVDGNDDRGIDVGIMTKGGYEIESIRSNVDVMYGSKPLFNRDCPEYKIRTPSGEVINVLVNHFKSKSGGGGQSERQHQATEVRRIVNRLVSQGEHVVVLGDFNEGPPKDKTQAVNLAALYNSNSPLTECYSLPGFATGPRPGSFDSCGLGNRFDYIFVSDGLKPSFQGGALFRKGLWGSRKTRPTDWDTYPEMENGSQQASDHAAVYVELNI